MKYADAGVNIALADQAKQKIARLAARTFLTPSAGASRCWFQAPMASAPSSKLLLPRESIPLSAPILSTTA
jgi:hypothetical protein